MPPSAIKERVSVIYKERQEMKPILSLVFTVLLVFSASSQTKTVTVISERANLRGTPSPSGAVVEQVSKDDVFELLTSKGAWYLVQSQKYAGWLNGNTIKLNFEIQASATLGLRDASPKVTEVVTTHLGVIEQPASAIPPVVVENSPNANEERTYITGERGGCYYINSNGNKTYVDRSVCGSSTVVSDPAPASSSGTVNVRGYYRKDGTYVRPHTRSSPRRP